MKRIETSDKGKTSEYLQQEKDPEVKVRLIALNLLSDMSVKEVSD